MPQSLNGSIVFPVRAWVFTWVGRLRRAHHRRARRVRWIRFRHLFSRTPQRGRIRGAVFLFPGDGWFPQINFLFNAHDLLATYLHGLDPHDFVANEAHKIYILRGHAIDPLLVLSLVGTLTHFLWRTSLGVDHHVVVHSHQHVVILNGILDLGRNGFEIRVKRRLGIEIKHRTQHLLQLWSGHLRDIFVEVEIHERAAGIGGRIRWRNWNR